MPNHRAVLASAALLCLACGCVRATEKRGRVGETASRQLGRNVTDVENKADDALDEPFERVQEGTEARLEELGDDAGRRSRELTEGGVEDAGGALRGALRRDGDPDPNTADASDEFDSEWADVPQSQE